MNAIIAATIEWHNEGHTILPVRADGSKAPAVTWAHHQTTQPDINQTITWATNTTGIGIVCGGPTQLEMLEVEGRATHTIPQVEQLMANYGLADLWQRINNGCRERTPTGGVHWHYHVKGLARGNTRLACTTDRQVMWETRGRGGFTIVAPSNGATHPNGGSWTRLAGNPANIPTITEDERDLLHAIIHLLDQTPTPPEPQPARVGTHPAGTGLRPGDDYNSRARWEDILEGWTRVRAMGQGWAWRRPGKREGISATTGQSSDGADRLYVFTTSTELPTETPISKFRAYTLLRHGGDYSAAAAQLRREGYGGQPTTPPTTPPPPNRDNQAPPDDHQQPPPPAGTPNRAIKLTSAADIEPRRAHWLWQGRISRGALAILSGREGVGKSTLAYWLAAQVSTGKLEGEHHGQPRAVLIAATEDSWAHTIVPRLIAAGADRHNIYRVEVTTPEGSTEEISLPIDCDTLQETHQETGAVLLLLDPLMSRLAARLDTHKDSEVRQALEPLTRVLADTGMSCVGLMHHNKSGSNDPTTLLMGSRAFAAVARQVLTVIKDPDDETQRVFGVAKNNLGPNTPCRAFTLGTTIIPTIDGDTTSSRIVWGEERAQSLSELLEAGMDNKTPIDEAAGWLDDYLVSQGGQAESAKAKKAGYLQGYSERTLQRAAAKLKLVSSSTGFPRRTVWNLPEAATDGNQPQWRQQ